MAQETIFRLFQEGSFYDFTVYTNPRTGRPVFRQRYNSKGKGIRYLSQQLNRQKMPLIVNSYRELMPFIGETFTDKRERESNYNAYFAANFNNITTYVPRQEARQGGVILEELVISQGPLQSIEYQYNADETKVITNIRLRGLTEITAQTTIGEFSRALTPQRSALQVGRRVIDMDRQSSEQQWLEGDELYFWRLCQDYDSVPTIHAERRMVQLFNNDERTLWSQTGQDGFTVEHTTVDGVEGYYLACPVVEETSVAWSHSRRGNPKLKDPRDRVLTSTQKTLGESSLVALYRSEQSLLKTLESYGGVNRVNYSAPTPNTGAYDLSQGLGSATDPEEGGTGNTGPTEEEGGSEGGGNNGGGSGNGGGQGGQTPQTVDITVVCADPMSGTPYGGGQLTPGTEQQIGVTPNFNWNFIRWNDGDTHNPRTITVPTSNTTYTATLQLQDQQKSQPQQQQ